jgi:signal transduction histidine kinase
MVRTPNRRAGLIRIWTWSMGTAALLLPLLAWWMLPDAHATAWAKAQAELNALLPQMQANVAALREDMLAGRVEGRLPGEPAVKAIFQSALDEEGRLLSPPQANLPEPLEAQIATTPASGFYYTGIQKLAEPAEALLAFEEATKLATAEEAGLKLQIDLLKAQVLSRLGRNNEAVLLLQLWWGMAADSWTLRGKPVGLLIGHRLADTLDKIGSGAEAIGVRDELRRRLLYGSWPISEADVILELQFLQPMADGAVTSASSSSAVEEARVGLHRRALLLELPAIAPEVGTFVGADGILLVDRLSRRSALYTKPEAEGLLRASLQSLIAHQPLFVLTSLEDGIPSSAFTNPLPSAVLETSALLLLGWQLQLTNLESYAAPLRQKQMLLLAVVSVFALALLALAWFGRRMIKREEALQRTRTEFLAGVSHELRTPAASLSLLSDNLLHGRVKGKERIDEYYRAMRRDARRLERLVADVLDVSRMDRGSFTIERQRCEIKPVLQALVEEQAPRLADGGIHLECVIEDDLPTLRLDAFAVERACANLLENARRYASDGAWAELRVSKTESGGIQIRVSDRGPGIPEAWRERIFESFERLPQDEQLAAGAGLGLALVRAVLLAHGGSVRVEQGRANIGAHFIMEFPADE